jgi:hypothetical protein
VQSVRLSAPTLPATHSRTTANEVLDLNADAIAFATLTYAMDTSSVNGA